MKIKDDTNFYLSDKSYKDKSLNIGKRLRLDNGEQWVTINSVNHSSGLQAIAVVPLSEYKHYQAGKIKEFKHMVFVSRGTNAKMDALQDANLVRHKNADLNRATKLVTPSFAEGVVDMVVPKDSDQFTQYHAFVSQTLKKYKTKDFSFTGHSLGGALADYEAVQWKKSATTYATARSFNRLSEEQQRLAKQGAYFDLLKDYSHTDDVVGMLPPNATVYYQRYFMQRNTSKSDLDKHHIGGHLASTFYGCFTSNGSAELLVKPDEIKHLGQAIKKMANTYFNTLIQGLEDFRVEMEHDVQKLVKKYKARTHGGDLGLLAEHDVEDAFRDMAVSKHLGTYRFYDDESLCQLINDLTRTQSEWRAFGDRIIDAAFSYEKNDGHLAAILGTNLHSAIGNTFGGKAGSLIAGFSGGK